MSLDWLPGAANRIAVLVFSVIGALTVLSALFWSVWKYVRDQRDRWALGDRYPLWRSLAIHDGAFDPTDLASLRDTLSRIRAELETTARSSFREWIDRQLRGRTLGSTSLVYEQLFSEFGLLLPIRFKREQYHTAITLLDLADLCQDDRPCTPDQGADAAPRVLLIGSGGTGKTLTCLGVARHISVKPEDRRWVLVLGANDLVPESQSGTEWSSPNWGVEIVARRLNLKPLSELRRRLLASEVETNAIVVIDGLDEISQRLGRSGTEKFLASWLFGQARIVTTSTAFYDSSLLGHPAVRPFEKAFAEAPSPAAAENFVRSACRVLFGNEGPRRARAITALRSRAPLFGAATRSPLLLTMQVALEGVEEWEEHDIDTIRVYEEFVEQSIALDMPRLGHIASRQALRLVYQKLAWIMCQNAQPHQVVAGDHGNSALTQLTASMPGLSTERDRGQLERLVTTSSLIGMAAGEPGGDVSTTASVFRHESFRDFLVAERVQSWMLGESEEGAGFFEWADNPGVSFFVKQYLSRARGDVSESDRVSAHLGRHLERLLEERTRATDENAARRCAFAAGQVASYLGLMGRGEMRARLAEVATNEPDLWIRRAAAIGLGDGGWTDCLDVLVDEMRSAIDRGDFGLARRHIAIELGLCGDQDFDPLDPARDQAGPGCQRLVTRRCAELDRDEVVAHWRLNLFSVLYLSKHRDMSRASFDGAIVESRDPLLDALLRLESRLAANCPEITEMRALLASLSRPALTEGPRHADSVEVDLDDLTEVDADLQDAQDTTREAASLLIA